jgi:hypothetical protein
MKHDRITHLSSAEYLELIQHTPFVARTTLTSLIRDTEEKFRCVRASDSCCRKRTMMHPGPFAT